MNKVYINSKIKCPLCNTKNRLYSNYCIKCGYKYTQIEKETAINHSFLKCYDKFKEWKDRFTLKVITENIIFRIVILAIILIYGIYNFVINGSNIKILESDNYVIQYNKKDNEYYLISTDNREEINLNLYIPNEKKEATVNVYDEEDKLIKKNEINKVSNITLKADYYTYYIIQSNNKDNIKFYVYNGGTNEKEE